MPVMVVGTGDATENNADKTVSMELACGEERNQLIISGTENRYEHNLKEKKQENVLDTG
jgi:hypothetical protein